MTGVKAAIWARVSTDQQETDNQVLQLQEWTKCRGFEVVQVYRVEASGWKGQQQKKLTAVYADARVGKYSVLIIWSLDRLSREGVGATLEIIKRLSAYRVKVISLQEGWLEQEGPMLELLLSVAAWAARWESERRSERTKAGLARAVSEGKRLGRPVGSKDKRKRSRRGYFARWAE